MKETIACESKQYKYKHIHIFGASGSGTTTMAKALSESLPHKHIDSDDFYWDVKFTKPNPKNIRYEKLKLELNKHPSWILSGSMIDWGNQLIPLFDLVIFISVTNEIRLNRLKQREELRYENEILPSGSKYKEHLEFMSWASQYETGDMNVRSRKQHKSWMNGLQCKIIEINGDNPVEDNKNIILNKISLKNIR